MNSAKHIPKTWLERQWASMPGPVPRIIKHSATLWEEIFHEGERGECHLFFNPEQKVMVEVEED